MLSLFHLLSSSDQGVKYNGLNRQRSTETTEITATILTKYNELILSEIKMDCIMASKRIANGENVRTLPTYLHLQKVSGFCSSAIVLPNLFCSFLESCFIPRDFKSKFFREILAYSLVEDFFLSFYFSLLIHFSSYILYPNYTGTGKSCQIKKKLPQGSFFFGNIRTYRSRYRHWKFCMLPL